MILDANRHDVERLLTLVRDFGGLDFPEGRRTGIERPIQAAMERHGVGSVAELVAYLSDVRHEAALTDLVASLTIGETHFFRNQPQVDAMRRVVLPEVIARHAHDRTIRIWSAGCSTGEEAYSIAIALDMLLPERSTWNITILGTDINAAALAKARTAAYGEWSFRGVPDPIRQRYFHSDGAQFRLAPAIREMVRFEYLNLVDMSAGGPGGSDPAMDVVLCRNVLIYFQPATIDAVVHRLEASLAPGGWMIAGHAEAPMPIFRTLFEPHDLPMAVLYRKRDGVAPAASDAAGPWLPVEVEPAPVVRLPDAELASPVVVPEPSSDPVADVIAAARRTFAGGDRRQAITMLQDEFDRRPQDPTPLVVAARLLAGATDYEPAERMITRALTHSPLSVSAHYVHALVLQGLNRPEAAVEALRRTAYLDPACVLAYFSLASLLDTMGQPDRARASLDRVVELLESKDDGAIIDADEGLTAGRLRDLAAIRRQLLHHEVGT